MIRIMGLYPNESGKKFDLDYYVNKHLPLLHQRLDPLGLVRAEIDKGVSGLEAGEPAPYIAVAYLYFNSVEEFQTALATHSAELMADIPNYTNIQPQIQISEIAD